MDIVSIKKFLRQEKPKPEDYIRFLQLLLNGVSSQAVETNDIDLTRFRQEVADISGQLSVQSSAEEIEAAVEFIIRAVTGYNRMAARNTHAHVHELQDMLAMMTTTIAFLSDFSRTGIEQLQVVEKNLQTASTIGDIRVLRSKMNDCLALVRSESTRLRDESQARIVELRAGVERTANHVRSAGISLPDGPAVPRERSRAMPVKDPLTGLRGRDAAEEQIADGISQGKEFVVTLFLVERFAQINRRYGSQAGDDVLLMVAQHLGKQLETSSLFKWSGPAFAAVTESEQPLPAIEYEMTRIASKRFEKTIEEDRRTVLLPFTCSSLVQKVSDADSLVGVAEIFDDFVATRAGERTPDGDAPPVGYHN
jgi:GGDEF domain-containing protein